MHTVFLILACLLFVMVSFSQNNNGKLIPKTSDEKAEKIRQHREGMVQNLLNAANLYPIEISAELTFLVVDVRNALTDDRKKEIFQDIFRRAGEAKEPFKMRQFEGYLDSRPGYRAKALSLDRDQLSIRLSVVRKLLPLDKEKAKELFISLKPRVKPLGCRESLGYDLTEYYIVAKLVAESSFSPEAIKNRENVFFTSTILDEISSPSQISPAIYLITKLKTNKDDFGVLLTSFDRSLGRVNNDPRSFFSALKYDRLTMQFMTFTYKVAEKGYQSIDSISAYKRFFEQNLSGIQCSDSRVEGTKELPHPLVGQLNSLLLAHIDPEDIKPSSIEPAESPFVYWRSEKSSKLLNGVKRLRFGDGEVALSIAQRSDQLWEEEFLRFLREMDEWKLEDEETVDDYLNQKSVLYESLYELSPPGRLRDEVVLRYSVFIRDFPFQKDVPGQWLFYVKRLLAMAKAGEKQGSDMLGPLERVGCEICSLYTRIDELRQSDPKSIPTNKKSTPLK